MTCGQLTVSWHYLLLCSVLKFWWGWRGGDRERYSRNTSLYSQLSVCQTHTKSHSKKIQCNLSLPHMTCQPMPIYIPDNSLWQIYTLCYPSVQPPYRFKAPQFTENCLRETNNGKNIQISDSFLWIGTSPEENILQHLQSMWFIFERRGWGWRRHHYSTVLSGISSDICKIIYDSQEF